jgi:hypothetical protein
MWRFLVLLLDVIFLSRYRYGYQRTPRSPLSWIGTLLGVVLLVIVLHYIYHYYLTAFSYAGDSGD